MIGELVGLIIVVILIFLLFTLVKKIFILIINSVIGLFALMGFNTLFYGGVEIVKINFWSVIITAIGGIIGFIIVLIMHYLHIAF